MRLSIYSLLQSLLFLSFCCRFSEAENEKFDAAHHHSTNNTTPQFQYARSGPEINRDTAREHLSTNSSKADFPCPDSAVIAPCTCTVDSDNKITIDCDLVESVDQLVEVFKQDFPVKELYRFSMFSNSYVDYLPSFMNGVSFESICLWPGNFFALKGVSEQFLLDQNDTLKEMYLSHSKLTNDSFPFYILPLMQHLDVLRIYYSDIIDIPPLRAPSLSTFAIEYSAIELLSNGTFSIGPGPLTLYLKRNYINTIELGSFFFADENSTNSDSQIKIDLTYNKLQSLTAGTFPISNGAIYIYLNYNQITSVEPGTFVLPASTGDNSNEEMLIELSSNRLHSIEAGTFPMRNGLMTFYLYSNRIFSIEPGTFVLPASTDMLSINLSLHDNLLTSFENEVYGSLMPFITDIRLSGNPLACDCDIAWLIVNSDFMDKVDDDATCANGTNLNDLDPQQFIDSC